MSGCVLNFLLKVNIDTRGIVDYFYIVALSYGYIYISLHMTFLIGSNRVSDSLVPGSAN